MVKTFVFLYPLILQAHNLFKRIYSTIHSLLPSNKSSNTPILINKKRKSINKKELRSYAQRKLIRKSKNIPPKQLQLNALQINDACGRQEKSEQSNDKLADCQSIKGKFVQFVKNSSEDLICSVCRQLILLPVTTQCDHIFCLKCIQSSLIVSNKCPLCRAPIANQQSYGIHRIKSVETIIKIKEWPQDDEHKNKIKEHQEWKNDRFVDLQSISQGQKVDVWKSDSREWKKAQINIVYRDEDDIITSLQVSFDTQTKQHNEVIQLPSFRIAKLNFYSSKYDNDQFTFPDFHFRNSVRIAPQYQFSIHPTFRRSIHPRLNINNPIHNPHLGLLRSASSTALVPIMPPPFRTLRRMFAERTNSNSEPTQIGTNQLSVENQDEYLLGRLSQQFQEQHSQRPNRGQQAPQQNDQYEMTDLLLPNLNPMQGLVRQASESEQSQSSEQLSGELRMVEPDF